ncbi:G patch domain containing protein 8 [Dissostichus eleginoides]|uniref:G patch domain containing protein 8 n=1 Tax=Dissostichus eleginoides TaxID=100907 RepID=A0AAD9FL99_DISEL|nr:G patch domain containing protein 8 [Dissostichus eleginoides]
MEPGNQTGPDSVQNWSDTTLGTKPQTSRILPLDAGCWAYDSMDANRTTTSSESCITQMDYDNTSATENTSPKTSHFNKIPWAHNYLSNPITPNNVPANGSTPQKIQTTADISSTPNIQSRIRPVSFSLPKRSCFLLHQSAAVFIQGLSGKQEEGVTVQERVKDLQEKVSHRTLRSPVSADVENQNLNQNPELNGLDDKPDVSTNGDQVSLCNRSEIPVEEPVVSGNEAQVLLRNDNGTGARVGSESGIKTHLYLNNGTAGQVSVVAKDPVNKTHDYLDNQDIDSTEDQVLPASNQPQTSIPGVLNDTLNPKESSFPPPNRPKEPFCRVLSRDGTRVFLWPSEMLSFTKTSPSISFSINPLLVREDGRMKGRNDEKRGRLLSNLPVNRCNRCDQLQVKSIEHQSQQSASRKPLYRGEACNPAISPVPGSEIETSRCPTMGEMHEITGATACNPAISLFPGSEKETPRCPEMGEMHEITGEQAEQRRNLIRGEFNPVIIGVSEQEATGICVSEPPGETAEDTFSCDTADKFNDCEDEEMRKRCTDGPFRDFNFHSDSQCEKHDATRDNPNGKHNQSFEKHEDPSLSHVLF